MVEQRNWKLLAVILPPGEFREPEIYDLKMCVLLCLHSYFCIMRAYYIAFLIMSINIHLQFKAVEDQIRNKHMKEKSCLQGSLQGFVLNMLLYCSLSLHPCGFHTPSLHFFLMKRLNNLQQLQPAC